MDANIYETSGQRGKTSLSAFTDELEGELEKMSIFGVHLTRKVVLSVFGLVVGVSVILGVSLSSGSKGRHHGAITLDHRYWSLGDVIESSVGKDIYDNTTNQHDALLWLAEEDPLKLDPSHPLEELLQRFILAYFFFSTGGDVEWENHYKFLTKKSVCDWNDKTHGVFCNENNQVTAIVMPEVGLAGTIPHDIGLLSNMETFNLTRNELSGSIPPSIGIWSSLKTFDLRDNVLTGPMPKSLAMLLDLVNLDLSYNELTGGDDISFIKELPYLEELHLKQNFLSGKIGQFGGSSSLRVIDLSYNSFSGEFSTRVPSGKSLEVLRMDHNLIQGMIPGSFGKFTNLKELSLSYNALSGSLPSNLGDLTNLESLKLNANEFEYGLPPELGNLDKLTVLEASENGIESIPVELFNAKSLERLSLPSNGIRGSLPTEIGLATSLTYVDLSNNRLTNELPAELTNLKDMEILFLHDNLFYGSIPVEIYDLHMLRELDLSDNDFIGSMESQFCGDRPHWGNLIETFRADCLTDVLDFSCATECCDGKGLCCPTNQPDCHNPDDGGI